MNVGFNFHLPWEFQWLPSRFDPDQFSEIRHKFRHMSLKQLDSAETAYRERSPEFDKVLSEYFSAHDPLVKLRELCNSHHRLSERNNVIVPALIAFQAGHYSLFCSAAVLQIEGMFEDCCLELGVNPGSLQRQSIGPKLDSLMQSNALPPNYPYYAYYFPRLRNKLAHGRLLNETEARRTSELLVLDLVDVASHVVNAPSHNNVMIAFLREASTVQSENIIKFATLAIDNVDCPLDFYGLEAKYHEFMDALVNKEESWVLLHKLTETRDPAFLANVQFLAKSLKKREISTSRCIDLLREIGENKEELFDRINFWCQLDEFKKD